MTQKEKAKAYDEAIKRAREYWKTDNDNTLDIKAKGTMEYLFPELAESEDERIRTKLLNLLKELLELGGVAQDTWSMNDCEQFIAWLEKQGEYKPADNVEPKFKVGDWINGYYTNYKVLSVNNKGYVVEDVDGNKINILFENEKFHHLWSIKDAKDGDVLNANGAIFIYSGHSIDYVYYYCGVNLADEFVISKNGNEAWNSNSKIYPATQQQRYLLFKKMEENSYSWNAEEKRLMYWGAEPSKLMGNSHTETIKKWSEEDGRLLKISIACLSDFAAKGYENAVECIDWLKSLKERIGG